MLGARGLGKQLPARKGRILAEHGIERETGFGAQDPTTKELPKKRHGRPGERWEHGEDGEKEGALFDKVVTLGARRTPELGKNNGTMARSRPGRAEEQGLAGRQWPDSSTSEGLGQRTVDG